MCRRIHPNRPVKRGAAPIVDSPSLPHVLVNRSWEGLANSLLNAQLSDVTLTRGTPAAADHFVGILGDVPQRIVEVRLIAADAVDLDFWLAHPSWALIPLTLTGIVNVIGLIIGTTSLRRGRVSTAVYSKGIIITNSTRPEAIIADAVMTETVIVAIEKSVTLSGGQGK